MHPFRHILLWLALLGPCAAAASGRGGEIDTLVTVEDVRITVRSLKEARTPIDSPVAVSHFGREEAERQRIATLRDLSALVPNLHVPDYGSRMTSSVYVRGLGARIDQPVLGLLVDDIPVMNKDAYDFDVTDILGIEVLRGPQSTLYGRNTMGGVMRIRTRSPAKGSAPERSTATATPSGPAHRAISGLRPASASASRDITPPPTDSSATHTTVRPATANARAEEA